MKSSKSVSILLVLLLALMSIFVTGFTAYAVNTDVDITGKSVSDIETDIQAAINGIAEEGTVTVIGSKTTGVDSEINLTIPAGITVIWKAVYAGQASSSEQLHKIILIGEGTFEVAEGGEIIVEPDSYGTYAHANQAIRNRTNFEKVTIIVSGGVVSNSSNDGGAIWGGGGNVIITGGKLSAGGYSGAVVRSSGDITISGGTVEVSGDNGDYGTAIVSDGGTVTINGGIVSAKQSGGSALNSAGDVFINGGTIEAGGGSASNAVIWIARKRQLTMTGGTVEATAKDGTAIRVYENIAVDNTGVNALILGGQVKASGENGCAINIAASDGIAAYLAGTCTGDFVGFSQRIVEVDALVIPRARHNTSEGLSNVSNAEFLWNTTGAVPVIQYGNISFEWGSFDSNDPYVPEPEPKTCGCCDNHNHSNNFFERIGCFFCKIWQLFQNLFK